MYDVICRLKEVKDILSQMNKSRGLSGVSSMVDGIFVTDDAFRRMSYFLQISSYLLGLLGGYDILGLG